MVIKNKKTRWYESWWGSLWTLAIVDANPGRGFSIFLQVDKDLQDLKIDGGKKIAKIPFKARKTKRIAPCLADAPIACEI